MYFVTYPDGTEAIIPMWAVTVKLPLNKLESRYKKAVGFLAWLDTTEDGRYDSLSRQNGVYSDCFSSGETHVLSAEELPERLSNVRRWARTVIGEYEDPLYGAELWTQSRSDAPSACVQVATPYAELKRQAQQWCASVATRAAASAPESW